MRQLFIGFVIALCISTGCANKTAPLVAAQVSHDSLALAQDIEAQLCWNVPNVKSGPANRTHCTSETAVRIKLTDDRHQKFNAKLTQAFDLHKKFTALARVGSNPNITALTALISSIVEDLRDLEQISDVTRLISAVKGGDKIQ
jgi:hypothetical protein